MQLIDADAIKYTARFTDYADGRMTSDAIVTKDEIDGLPTIDAVQVVRCKDCEYYYADEKWCRRLGLCGAFNEDDFCSHGKRREDDE